MTHFTTTLGDGAVRMELDESLFPRDALYGAAYAFIDRCYVHLDRGAGKLAVELRVKAGSASSDVLEGMAGELQNELLGLAWRHQIIEQSRSLIDSVTTRALGGAGAPALDAGAGSLDDLLAGGDATFEDPLGIAMSWEQKYAKKGDAEATAGETPAPAAQAPGAGQGGAS
jgi:His-Xaa-Ser system protein HxsD